MAVSLNPAPQTWNGSTVDARSWGGIVVTCTVAPSVAWTIQGSPDNNADFMTVTGSLNNANGIGTPVTTISGIGIYTIPGSQFVQLSGGTGGTFFIAGTPVYLAGGGGGGSSSSPSFVTIEGPSGNQATVLSDGALSVQPIQGTVTNMTLVAGTPIALDLRSFSSAQIQTAGFSADSVLVEQSMDGVVWVTAYLMKADATSPFAGTALNSNGIFSVYGFAGELRFTRTGSADTLTFKVKGAN